MATYITNTLRSSSTVRAEGAGTSYANLVSLAANANETVTSADIKRINWTTGGNIAISRNGEVIATLYGNGEIRCDEWGHSISTNNTSNVAITITTGGTVFLELSKSSTYATPLTGI